MAEFNDIETKQDINEVESEAREFSPIYSYTQKINRLMKEGAIKKPKYRTLSEEQYATYYKAKDIPGYNALKDKTELEKAKENTFFENMRNQAAIEVADLLSFDNTRLAIGNMLVTGDYSPLTPLAAGFSTVASGVVGSLIPTGAEAPTLTGRTPEESLKDYQNTVKRAKKAFDKGEITEQSYLEWVNTAKSSYEKEVSAIKEAKATMEEPGKESLSVAGYTKEQQEEAAKDTKVQALGRVILDSAWDDIQYKASIAPQVDEKSIAATLTSGAFSFGELLAIGAGAKMLSGQATKAIIGQTATERGASAAAAARLAETKAGKIATGAVTTEMTAEIMGGGAFESIKKYIEDTGDTKLEYYDGDVKNVALDALNATIQNVIEYKLGVNKFFRNPRAASKYGEWLNGFAQEFTQGGVNDIFEFIKGNQEAKDILENLPQNLLEGLVGAILQGGTGSAIYHYYHNQSVNNLTDVIMSQATAENPINEKDARAFAEQKIAQLEEGLVSDLTNEIIDYAGASKYEGKIYDTVRDNVEKTINAQREAVKDTLEGSDYDEMTEDELAQYIESVAQDVTDRAVIDALDRQIPLAESPLLKGETIDGTYYLEGADFGRRTPQQARIEREEIRDAVYAAQNAAEDAKKQVEVLREELKPEPKPTPVPEMETITTKEKQVDQSLMPQDKLPESNEKMYQQRQRGKGGAYDARTRSITLGARANITTLPHELAHYWIDKNFKWARSGKASAAWLAQWRAVEKWLGITPEDKYLSSAASEKFARAYERFLGEEELPLVLKKSMADFRDFVLYHYDYELDDAKGLQDRLGRPIKLNDAAREWFRKSIYDSYVSPDEQAVVDDRLALADKEYKDVEPQIKEQQEIETVATTSADIDSVAPTGMQIQRDADVSNSVVLGKRAIGGGEERESKGKIAQALGKTYEATNWDAQEEMVSAYLEKVSVDEALDALDNETYPDKIDANFLRQALVEKLLEEGREIEAAALIEETADDFTESAQKLQAARRINTPFTNAIRMLTVGKAMKLAEARYGKNPDAVKSLDSAINALVAKYEQDYANAKTDEERELVFANMQDEAVRTIGSLDKSTKNALDFQEVDDKEERKQAKAVRKRQIKRASIKAYRSRAKRALKQALGLEPTREQVREIKKLAAGVAKEIRDYRKAVKENKVSAIDPTAILEAQNKLNEYMNKQLPPRVLTNITDAINNYMMANMLWNPATNVFNIESTWVQMIPHMLGTYIDYGKGTIPWKEKIKLIKQALALQAKTGYNIFSLRDFFDKKTLWAEKFYEPKSKLGKVQAFPLTMLGLADTANKGVVFLQRADAMATKQAKQEGKGKERAKELFYQALNTDPRTITIDGLKIREAAVKEGEEATFTQMTSTAELVNKFRKLLNFGQSTGVGTLIMPFTTTISNIAEDTVKNYMFGSVRGIINAPKALATQFDKSATAEMKKEAWKAVAPETKNVIKNMIGITMLLSIALGGADDEDFVLGYDRQTEMDKDIRQNRNAPSGYAIRLGNRWIDLDLFGIGSPWARAYLVAKRDGFTPDGWVKGFASNIDLVPGVAEIQDMYDRYSQLKTWSGDWEALSDLGSDKLADVVERFIPAQALFNEIGNITDTTKRVSWERWYDRAISKIPGLRKILPERTSRQTGQPIPQTDTLFNLLTGQRIKEYIAPTAADTARYEFALSGKALSYREANSKLKELGKDTEEYNKAIARVRQIFTADLERVAQTKEYKDASIDEKRKIANKLHTQALETVKADYGLTTKKPKKRLKNK